MRNSNSLRIYSQTVVREAVCTENWSRSGYYLANKFGSRLCFDCGSPNNIESPKEWDQNLSTNIAADCPSSYGENVFR